MPIVLHLWRWRLTHPQTFMPYTTRNLMSDADALQIDPKAVRIEGTYEMRVVPGPSLPEGPKPGD